MCTARFCNIFNALFKKIEMVYTVFNSLWRGLHFFCLNGPSLLALPQDICTAGRRKRGLVSHKMAFLQEEREATPFPKRVRDRNGKKVVEILILAPLLYWVHYVLRQQRANKHLPKKSFSSGVCLSALLLF